MALAAASCTAWTAAAATASGAVASRAHAATAARIAASELATAGNSRRASTRQPYCPPSRGLPLTHEKNRLIRGATRRSRKFATTTLRGADQPVWDGSVSRLDSPFLRVFLPGDGYAAA